MQEAAPKEGSERAAQVRTIFSEIAPRYDLLNHVLSLNIDRSWRRAAVGKLDWERTPGGLYLDACAGTFDLSLELARRSRFAGRVVATDTDWGMHAVHGADTGLTTRIIECWRDDAANGLSGRHLSPLFAAAGLRDTEVVAETMTSTDPGRPTVAPFTTMAALAERCGAVSPGDAQEWLDQLADAGAQGRFFWALTMFAAAGTRP